MTDGSEVQVDLGAGRQLRNWLAVTPLISEEIVRKKSISSLSVLRTAMLQERRTLILILPFGMSTKPARRLADAFGIQYNVLTWQCRGLRGDLDELTKMSVLDVQSHADDMRYLMHHYQVHEADIVGFCSGAGVGLVAASGAHAQFKRLVLVCGEYVLPRSACRPTNFQRDIDSLLTRAAQGRRLAADLYEKLKDRLIVAGSEYDDDWAMPFASAENVYRHSLSYMSYRTRNFRAIASEVPHLAMFVSTSEDRHVTPESSAIIASSMRHPAQHVVFKGDHYELLRCQPEIIARILQFLGDPDPNNVQ